MRLVFVHGINQEGKSESQIREEWLDPLERGLGRSGGTAGINVSAPFYGDVLDKLTNRRGDAIAQGTEATDMNEAMFIAATLNEQAQAAGIGAKAINAEERAIATHAVQQAFPMDRRINAILRLIEKVSPFHGDFVMRVLQQAYAYLKRPGVSDEVDAVVRPTIDTGPAVIVGHSLGAVVTFRLLRQLALERRPIPVPLYVTVGSPLPLMGVQAALGPEFKVPTGVDRWLNVVDPDDLIALGQGLDRATFADGIDNILDIRNIPGNPHSIQGYLSDARVASAIVTACGAP